jgi:hypothetical protein
LSLYEESVPEVLPLSFDTPCIVKGVGRQHEKPTIHDTELRNKGDAYGVIIMCQIKGQVD